MVIALSVVLIACLVGSVLISRPASQGSMPAYLAEVTARVWNTLIRTEIAFTVSYFIAAVVSVILLERHSKRTR